MKSAQVLCVIACALCACLCAPAHLPDGNGVITFLEPQPPRKNVLFNRPHSSIPTWFPPDGLTWIQKVYYTLSSYVGSVAAAGFGTFLGPLGPFVSAFSQPYLSTYVSRLTSDVLARSLDSDVPFHLDNELSTTEDASSHVEDLDEIRTSLINEELSKQKHYSKKAYKKFPVKDRRNNAYLLNDKAYLIKDKNHDDDSDDVDQAEPRTADSDDLLRELLIQTNNKH